MKQQYHREPLNSEDMLTIRLSREGLHRLVNEELHRSALSVGVMVISELLENEVNELCGPRRRRNQERVGYRHGTQKGCIVVGGQKVRIEKPRVRTTDSHREVHLDIYRRLQQLDVIDKTVMRRLVRGVSCRNYRSVIETITGSVGVTRSSVSRAFVRATEERVREFFSRRFTGTRFAAIFIDGVLFKGQTMIVALGVTSEGKKVVLSVRQGATENARVCMDLLEELRERGVSTEQTTLFVLDGSKALHAAVARVWGGHALIQRCQLHKMRNVRAYVSDELWADVQSQMRSAYAEKDVAKARKRLLTTAKWLDRVAPAAARSLREGLDETLTVASLRLPGKLIRSLLTTNPVESPFQRVRSITRRVTRWTGEMRIRWCVAGLLEAEARFNRISGAKHIDKLVAALDRIGEQQTRLSA
jgi:transposase-like protein